MPSAGFGPRPTSSGYTLTFDHDDLDRLTKITHPDSTFEQFTYDRLDPVVIRDRAGRQTFLEYDNVRQMTKRTDPLGRVTLFEWCPCGDLSSLTDPMGRTTSWNKDVQGRLISKQYGDGSQIQYFYENATSRVRQVIDEKQQVTQFTYNRDDTLKSIDLCQRRRSDAGRQLHLRSELRTRHLHDRWHGNHALCVQSHHRHPDFGRGPTGQRGWSAAQRHDHLRLRRTGPARLHRHQRRGLRSDLRCRRTGHHRNQRAGRFAYAYDGALPGWFPNPFPTARRRSELWRQSGGRTSTDHPQVGATPISEFLYGRDLPAARITTWSQQVGAQPPSIHTFGYDAADQLLSATVTNSGALVNTFAYTYDPAGNRLTERASGATNSATYNALNQSAPPPRPGRCAPTNGTPPNRLVAVNVGKQPHRVHLRRSSAGW